MIDRDEDDLDTYLDRDDYLEKDDIRAALFRSRNSGRKRVQRVTKPLSSSANPFSWQQNTRSSINSSTNQRTFVPLNQREEGDKKEEERGQSFVESSADILGEIYDSYQYSTGSAEDEKKSMRRYHEKWNRAVNSVRNSCRSRFSSHKSSSWSQSPSQSQSQSQSPNSILNGLKRLVKSKRDEESSYINQYQNVLFSSKVSPSSFDNFASIDNSPENNSIKSHTCSSQVPSYSLDYKRRIQHNKYLRDIYHREVLAKAERQRIYLSKQKYATSQVLLPINSNTINEIEDGKNNKTITKPRKKYTLLDSSIQRFKPLNASGDNPSSKSSSLRSRLRIFKI